MPDGVTNRAEKRSRRGMRPKNRIHSSCDSKQSQLVTGNQKDDHYPMLIIWRPLKGSFLFKCFLG